MAKNKTAKKGDIFKVKLQDNEVGFFQYLLLDPCQLNSEVIRVFAHRAKDGDNYDLEAIVKSKVHFFAHVVIPFGYNLNVWENIGNVPIEKDLDRPLFRDTYGIKHEFDGRKILYKKTDQWKVWRAGDPHNAMRNLGWITKENEDIDLGFVINPIGIIHRMIYNEYQREYYT